MNKRQVEFLLTKKDKIISNDDSLDIYKRRCVICYTPTRSLHEIVPRSLSMKAMEWFNRVPICLTCHLRVHSDGANNHAEELYARRNKCIRDYWGVDA